ncbi:ATPase [Erwinia sp. MYb416]|uniref:ATPase n=1 Tax=Erwinia sp. MYb416 TaxID=3108532 RepID=UPI0030A74624
MTDITYYDPLPEQVLQLSAEINTAKLARLYRARKGHSYIYGWTGTGKSIVSRRLASRLKADYFNYELLTLSQWKSGFDEIAVRVLNSDKKVVIIDGFFPLGVDVKFQTLIAELNRKGVNLFIFSQEPPSGDYPSQYQKHEFVPDVFETIVEFRYGTLARYPVTFHQVK